MVLTGTIFTSDIGVLEHFYREVFGLERVERGHPTASSSSSATAHVSLSTR